MAAFTQVALVALSRHRFRGRALHFFSFGSRETLGISFQVLPVLWEDPLRSEINLYPCDRYPSRRIVLTASLAWRGDSATPSERKLQHSETDVNLFEKNAPR